MKWKLPLCPALLFLLQADKIIDARMALQSEVSEANRTSWSLAPVSRVHWYALMNLTMDTRSCPAGLLGGLRS